MDVDRMKHTLAVARKMVEIGKNLKLTEEQQQELFTLGFVHDIGYEYPNKDYKHNVVGGEILKENGYKYWEEVYYHGNPNTSYESLYLTILNMADMQIDKYGNDVGYIKRLEDIKNRYGSDSIPYQNCVKIINQLQKL